MNEKCPCEAVVKLQEIAERHDQQLNDGKINFAVINTKLNIVLGVMATIGIAICGIVVKMMFAMPA